MNRGGNKVQLLNFALALVCIQLAASSTSANDDWLTEPEREFISALGIYAQRNGHVIKRPTDIERMRAAVNSASKPMSERMERILSALEEMKVPPEELKAYADLIRKGVSEMRGVMLGAMIDVLLRDDPLGAAIDGTNQLLKSGTVQEAWKLQQQWLERGLKAREKIDAEWEKICEEWNGRIAQKRPVADMPLRITLADQRMCIEGRPGKTPFTKPVLELTIYNTPTRGAWQGLNFASGLVVRMMGVNAMDLKAQSSGARLANAQERAMNLPFTMRVLLPDLDADGKVQVATSLPYWSVLGVEKVSARIWSAEGLLEVEEVPGLAEQRKRLQLLVAEEIRTRKLRFRSR